MAIGDRIQVAQESTSETILEKVGQIEQSSGVVVASDGKKYLPKFIESFTFEKSNLTRLSNFIVLDEGEHFWEMSQKGIIRYNKDTPSVSSFFPFPTYHTTQTIRSISSVIPNYTVTKVYNGRIYFVVINESTYQFGIYCFDTATETYSGNMISETYHKSDFVNVPTVEVFPEGYALLTLGNNIVASSTRREYFYKIDDNGRLTDFPGSKYVTTTSQAYTSDRYVFIKNDCIILIIRTSGSNMEVSKHSFSNFSNPTTITISAPINASAPVMVDDLIYVVTSSADTTNVINTIDMSRTTINTPGTAPSPAHYFAVNNRIFHISVSSWAYSFYYLDYNPTTGATNFYLVDQISIPYYVSGGASSVSPNVQFFQFHLGMIGIRIIPPSALLPSDGNAFLMELGKKHFAGYEEVVE